MIIRTKERIIDTSNWEAHYSKKGDEYVLESYTANFNVLMGVLADDIIAEADTIEELCDGLIVEEKGNESNWFIMSIGDFKNLSDEDKRYQAKDWAFKAFIKTDKGFVFVAEMNKNGVLELL